MMKTRPRNQPPSSPLKELQQGRGKREDSGLGGSTMKKRTAPRLDKKITWVDERSQYTKLLLEEKAEEEKKSRLKLSCSTASSGPESKVFFAQVDGAPWTRTEVHVGPRTTWEQLLLLLQERLMVPAIEGVYAKYGGHQLWRVETIPALTEVIVKESQDTALFRALLQDETANQDERKSAKKRTEERGKEGLREDQEDPKPVDVDRERQSRNSTSSSSSSSFFLLSSAPKWEVAERAREAKRQLSSLPVVLREKEKTLSNEAKMPTICTCGSSQCAERAPVMLQEAESLQAVLQLMKEHKECAQLQSICCRLIGSLLLGSPHAVASFCPHPCTSLSLPPSILSPSHPLSSSLHLPPDLVALRLEVSEAVLWASQAREELEGEATCGAAVHRICQAMDLFPADVSVIIYGIQALAALARIIWRYRPPDLAAILCEQETNTQLLPNQRLEKRQVAGDEEEEDEGSATPISSLISVKRLMVQICDLMDRVDLDSHPRMASTLVCSTLNLLRYAPPLCVGPFLKENRGCLSLSGLLEPRRQGENANVVVPALWLVLKLCALMWPDPEDAPSPSFSALFLSERTSSSPVIREENGGPTLAGAEEHDGQNRQGKEQESNDNASELKEEEDNGFRLIEKLIQAKLPERCAFFSTRFAEVDAGVLPLSDEVLFLLERYTKAMGRDDLKAEIQAQKVAGKIAGGTL